MFGFIRAGAAVIRLMLHKSGQAVEIHNYGYVYHINWGTMSSISPVGGVSCRCLCVPSVFSAT